MIVLLMLFLPRERAIRPYCCGLEISRSAVESAPCFCYALWRRHSRHSQFGYYRWQCRRGWDLEGLSCKY